MLKMDADIGNGKFRKSGGFVLLLIVLTLLAVGAAVLLTGIGTGLERSSAQSATIAQRLLISRDALVGYAIGAFGGGARPGQLPSPDTLQNSNYDGMAEVGCLNGVAVNGLPALSGAAAKTANLRCIGRLPWKTLGLQLESVDEFDALGLVPWYAVSANLADPNFCLQYLNSGTVAQPPVGFVCPSASAPPFPWLKVCDESGRLLSDRVAFVVIYPGAPIATQGRTQSRAGTPRPQPADFLDAIPVPLGWSALPVNQRCTTYDNAALNNEFVTASTTANFNDRLVYVTIDELMGEVEKRVAVELREAVRNFQHTRLAYPWLVPLKDPTSPTINVAVPNTLAGFVPFHTTDPSNSFLSELGWTIPTGESTLPVSSSPTFPCGTFTCRLRAIANAPITNTVAVGAVDARTTDNITSPIATCNWTSNGNLEAKCTYTFPPVPLGSQTYLRQRSDPGPVWTDVGPIFGNNTRTVKADFFMIGTVGAPTPATATSVFQRSVSASGSTLGMVSITDTFVDTAGTISTPVTVGFRETSGSGLTTVRGIRAYPIMPNWYFAEKWNQYSFAALSPDVSPVAGAVNCSANCFEAGPRKSLDAIIATTGAPFAGQNRNQPTPPLNAFLEDVNATGLTTGPTTYGKFNAVGTPKTLIYNDAIATLPP